MASSAKTCFLLFLVLTVTLSSKQILARDSQFFNKVPSTNNNNGVPEFAVSNKQPLNKLPEEEPNFIPENENNNGYGLYGHESGQLPPSTTNDNGVRDSFRPANAKYLPKNYNTEAYVTEPEGYTPSTTTAVPENNNNNNNPFSIPNSKYLPKNYNTESYVTEPEGYTPTTATEEYRNENNNQNYYNNGYQNGQQQEYPTGANTHNNNYYGNGNRQQQSFNTGANNNYNSFAQREYTTAAVGGNNNNNYDHYTNGGVNSNNGYQRQGMSDTRFLENGKFFYDLNLEKSTFNPNDVNTREFSYDNQGYYNNNNNNMNRNSYEYNNDQNYAGFQNNHNQFQNFQEEEEDMP